MDENTTPLEAGLGYFVGLDKSAARIGLTLRPEARSRLLQLTHYGLGMGPGVLYALLRRRVPLLGAGMGVAYGLLLFALNDELMNAALGLSGPPEASRRCLRRCASNDRGVPRYAVMVV